MSKLYGFILLNGHATFEAVVGPFANFLLVFDDVTSFDKVSTINTLNRDVWADRFMVLNLALDAHCAAIFVSFAFYGVKKAYLIVIGYL